jgi:4-amino-4-deoxy-L-arabinose transferase-like glycosyltransferase
LGTVAAIVLLSRLGRGSLQDWDEAIYAQVSREIVQSGSWMTLHWNFRPWFQKPPLLMWITALLYKAFGVTEFWARAASAISGIGVVLLTYLVGASESGPLVGSLAATILLTGYHFVLSARMGMTDVMLTLFTYAAGYAYLRLREHGEKRWWYLVSSGCALAVMVKSAAGAIPVLTIAFALLADREFSRAIRSKEFWLAVLLGIAICAPWHIWMVMQHGRDFTSDYIGYQIVARAQQARARRGGGPLFYVIVLARDFFPWFCAVPFATLFALHERISNKSKSWLLPVTGAVVFGICTAVRTKIAQYIIPIYPALAILTAVVLMSAFRPWNSPRFRALVAASAMMVGLAAVQGYDVPINASAVGRIARSAPLVAITCVIVCTLVWFAISLWQITMQRMARTAVSPQPSLIPRFSAIIMCGSFFVFGAAKLVPLYNRREEPVAHLAKLAAATRQDDREPLIVFSMPQLLFTGINRPAPLFYSNRPTLEVHTREELAQVANQSEWRRIIFEKQDLAWLRSEYDVSLLGEDNSLAYGMIRHKHDEEVDSIVFKTDRKRLLSQIVLTPTGWQPAVGRCFAVTIIEARSFGFTGFPQIASRFEWLPTSFFYYLPGNSLCFQSACVRPDSLCIRIQACPKSGSQRKAQPTPC